ncbi:hypothetical protein C8R43DRAFT_956832 [Mycena crocata]|nr:hypothetical protein C8R43DRAFT_956832 [Mycena crocata]
MSPRFTALLALFAVVTCARPASENPPFPPSKYRRATAPLVNKTAKPAPDTCSCHRQIQYCGSDGSCIVDASIRNNACIAMNVPAGASTFSLDPYAEGGLLGLFPTDIGIACVVYQNADCSGLTNGFTAQGDVGFTTNNPIEMRDCDGNTVVARAYRCSAFVAC